MFSKINSELRSVIFIKKHVQPGSSILQRQVELIELFEQLGWWGVIWVIYSQNIFTIIISFLSGIKNKTRCSSLLAVKLGMPCVALHVI